ncbi:Solute carrier 49 member 4 [Cichlidogyrus casuarinus]|uniref:Solute carrier 49 member 4 n=1 Tax=Cichlidogyrus casuarinus TaxID=1844966 RepID=A0ABD2PL16_9PLAT
MVASLKKPAEETGSGKPSLIHVGLGGPKKLRMRAMLMFCTYAFLTAFCFSTWIPVMAQYALTFHLSGISQTALYFYNPIIVFIFALPIGIMAAKMDFKNVMVLGSVLLFTGTGIKAIPVQVLESTPLIHIGTAIQGVCFAVMYLGIPIISATWFKPGLRTIPTAFITSSIAFGLATAFAAIPPIIDGNSALM